MTTESNNPKKRWSTKRILLVSIPVIFLTAGLLIYLNFNKIISIALKKAFEISPISELYELKFKNLIVNPLEGSIRVNDVTLTPRQKPLNYYPYINSQFTLETDKLVLENVDIRMLLESNKLKMQKIAITKPLIVLELVGSNPIFFPFGDSTGVSSDGLKKSLDSYFLGEFQLIDAGFIVKNSLKKREFKIEKFSISLQNLSINHQSGQDLIFLKHIDISLEKFVGNLKEDPLIHVNFSDFKIKFDSVNLQKDLDTLIYQFKDFKAGVEKLDIQTMDSVYHVTMNSFDLSYLEKSIKLKGLGFKPNVSNAVLQKNYKYQHAQYSGTVGSLDVLGIEFDSLFYGNKVLIQDVNLNKANISIYKDNTKNKDLNHFPVYLGQTVAQFKTPVSIKRIKATDVKLTNEEKKPDGTMAKVHLTKVSAEVKNFTNLSFKEDLSIQATGLLAEKVQVKLGLKFKYLKPYFSFEGQMSSFKLTDLNPIIQAYTPAKFTGGKADDITFSGIAERTSASGTFKFLYHDLKVDLELQDKAKWKNTIISFGANTALHTNNPTSPNTPGKVVRFQVERDMNKGFVNVIIKSILDGMKETMLMSKENRKEYQQNKKEARAQKKREKKEEKKN
jgi:hypothetical protein